MTNADKILKNDKVGIYTIFDNTFKAHNSPFGSRNDREALKVCRDILKAPDDSFTINADCLSLYRVGIFDQVTGVIVPELTKLVDFVELLPEEVKENA